MCQLARDVRSWPKAECLLKGSRSDETDLRLERFYVRFRTKETLAASSLQLLKQRLRGDPEGTIALMDGVDGNCAR